MSLSSKRAPTFVYKVTDRAFTPMYRPGDRLVLDLADPVVPGVRAVIVDTEGVVLAGEVTDWSDNVVLAIHGRDGESRRKRRDVAFAARIIWASQ